MLLASAGWGFKHWGRRTEEQKDLGCCLVFFLLPFSYLLKKKGKENSASCRSSELLFSFRRWVSEAGSESKGFPFKMGLKSLRNLEFFLSSAHWPQSWTNFLLSLLLLGRGAGYLATESSVKWIQVITLGDIKQWRWEKPTDQCLLSMYKQNVQYCQASHVLPWASWDQEREIKWKNASLEEQQPR